MDLAKKGFVLLLWVLAPSILTGQQVLTLDPVIGRNDLGGYLYILEDSAGTLSFDQIAIDDFGSGYSNFDHILRLNVDYLKLDASLIRNIDQDKNSQYVVETIVSFAQKLGIQTIAEFVHSQAVYEWVKSLDIDFSQGFFLCQPRIDL